MKGNQSILNTFQGENFDIYENSDGAEDVLSANNVSVHGYREGKGTQVFNQTVLNTDQPSSFLKSESRSAFHLA